MLEGVLQDFMRGFMLENINIIFIRQEVNPIHIITIDGEIGHHSVILM